MNTRDCKSIVNKKTMSCWLIDIINLCIVESLSGQDHVNLKNLVKYDQFETLT